MVATRIKDCTEDEEDKIIRAAMLSLADESESFIDEPQRGKLIEIDGPDEIWLIAFSADGEHVVSCEAQGKIRRWQVEDGKEVGEPMDAGSDLSSVAVSRDGKWIVSGGHGRVMVWDAQSHEKVSEFRAHKRAVIALDVSPDGSKIATGSDDTNACLWSLSDGKRLHGPFNHKNRVSAVKFSPDGRLIATATWKRSSLRVYDSHDPRLVVDFRIQVCSARNDSFAWVSDSKQLFALSSDGKIHCLDVPTGQSLSKWALYSDDDPGYISLANNGTFIATCDVASVLFWDTITHEEIGFLVHHPARITSLAISGNYDLVIGGGTKITLQSLLDTIPPPYIEGQVNASASMRDMMSSQTDR